MTSRRGPVIAIDGPAGSGKTTLGRRLALELGLPFVNTGVMYRALTALALARGVSLEDGPALADLLGEITFDLDRSESPHSLSVKGTSAAPSLSSPEVEGSVSTVSKHPEVRRRMAAAQRVLGARGAVMEGRDIGTVVFPDAEAKIFLAASSDERASRRIRERGGDEDLGRALADRDALDARVNPFEPVADAAIVETTGKDPDEVFAEALRIVRRRVGNVRIDSDAAG
jgi:cytidylate kinase